MTPGQKTEALRIAKALTQEQACALTEEQVSQSAWSSIECGDTTRPRAKTQAAMAWALGVEPHDIWPPRPHRLHPEHDPDPGGEAWSAVRATAYALDLDEDEPVEKRQRFGKWLVKTLASVDPGARDPDRDDGRWDELWRVATSLAYDPETTPLVFTDGDREIDYLTPPTKARVIVAKRRRVQAQKARVKAHTAATGDAPVSQRPRTRERRDTRRSSTRAGPASDGDPDEPEPASRRSQKRRAPK